MKTPSDHATLYGGLNHTSPLKAEDFCLMTEQGIWDVKQEGSWLTVTAARLLKEIMSKDLKVASRSTAQLSTEGSRELNT